MPQKIKCKNFSIFFIFIMTIIASIYTTTIGATEINNKPQHISYSQMGQGKPLVLIHAFPTDQQLWLPQQEQLKKHFQVITLDLWGFGHSSGTEGQAVTMNAYAEELKQLLDQLHIQKAIIGGESMGGYVALAFLKHYPERVEGLILSDTQSIVDNEETKKKREVTAKTVLKQGSAQLINDFIPKALSPEASNELRQSLRNILESQTRTGIASALRGMALREDTSSVLQTITLPILIITGDKDEVISPLQSQSMHRMAINSRYVEIAGAGHLSSLEKPEQWNQIVIDMFGKKSTLS